MIKSVLLKTLSTCILLTALSTVMAQYTPDKIYGQLFTDVQMGKVFSDGKTFVDCTPRRKPADIMYDYGLAKGPNFDLKKFVADNFNLPGSPPAFNYIVAEKDVTIHIKNLWNILKRDADKPMEGSSLLPLPNPYIVPGGRFREIYYWDSYFTLLGLKESGEVQMIENMLNNFKYLIDTYGHIPNGNRSYYLSRSQPPFFCMMIELLASIKGAEIYKTYLPALQKEYNYWMEGAEKCKPGDAFKRVVRFKDGSYLNRYWDDLEIPRQESYAEDVETAEKAVTAFGMTRRFASEQAMLQQKDSVRKKMYRNLRAAACSGWDFSSRWFADDNDIATIQTTDIVPVDLNCLMYKMELVLEKGYTVSKNNQERKKYAMLAYKREQLFRKYFTSKAINFFSDYNFVEKRTTDVPAASSLYLLKYLREPNPEGINSWGNAANKFIEKYLLKNGGLISTPNVNHQQWDSPNGWAPLQWMAITGLERCNQKVLAKEIATRWIKLNNDVYQRTGKLMEKYNVVDTGLEAGGGEYPGQDGFGWTNGVLLALVKKYGLVNN